MATPITPLLLLVKQIRQYELGHFCLVKRFEIDAKYRVAHIIQSPVSRNSGRFSATSPKYLARLALPPTRHVLRAMRQPKPLLSRQVILNDRSR